MVRPMDKIRNNHGETIGEMLVSSLIIALAIVMLVTMVNIATRLVGNSVDSRKKAFDAQNNAETIDDTNTPNASFQIDGASTAIGGPKLSITDSNNQGVTNAGN